MTRERIANLEALIESVPEDEDDYKLIARFVNLEAVDQIWGSLMEEMA